MISTEASIPVLTAPTGRSVATASICAATMSGGTSCTAVTSRVFWAVSAVITLMPKTPFASKALRSAWMPAPPPESEPAIVRAVGIGRDTWKEKADGVGTAGSALDSVEELTHGR